MRSVRSGSGHVLVVSHATYREETESLRLPLPVQFATAEARATFEEPFADLDPLQRRTGPDGFDGQATTGPFVSLNGANGDPDRSANRDGTATEEPPEGDPAFALGLHAATVGDGDPLSLRSLVGMRALPPGHYRNVAVPVWRGNPYPIVRPTRLGERPRTHWSGVDLVPADRGRSLVDVTATCWHGRGTDNRDELTPVRDWWGLPVTSTATVSFGNRAGADDRDPIVRGDPRGR